MEEQNSSSIFPDKHPGLSERAYTNLARKIKLARITLAIISILFFNSFVIGLTRQYTNYPILILAVINMLLFFYSIKRPFINLVAASVFNGAMFVYHSYQTITMADTLPGESGLPVIVVNAICIFIILFRVILLVLLIRGAIAGKRLEQRGNTFQ